LQFKGQAEMRSEWPYCSCWTHVALRIWETPGQNPGYGIGTCCKNLRPIANRAVNHYTQTRGSEKGFNDGLFDRRAGQRAQGPA
jgi:hypothetical protein